MLQNVIQDKVTCSHKLLVVSTAIAHLTLADSCEHSSEHSGSKKAEKFLAPQ